MQYKSPVTHVTSFEGRFWCDLEIKLKILFMIKIKIDQLFLKGTRDKNVSLPWKSGTRGRGQNKLLLEKFSEANQKARATRELPPRPDLVELYGPRSLRQL